MKTTCNSHLTQKEEAIVAAGGARCPGQELAQLQILSRIPRHRKHLYKHIRDEYRLLHVTQIGNHIPQRFIPNVILADDHGPL